MVDKVSRGDTFTLGHISSQMWNVTSLNSSVMIEALLDKVNKDIIYILYLLYMMLEGFNDDKKCPNAVADSKSLVLFLHTLACEYSGID